jgi:hypothetical protein
MALIEDIAGDLESEGESAPPAVEAPAATAQLGTTHLPKIAAAVRALQTKGQWPPNMRPGQAFRLIIAQLIADGHGGDLPERDTVRRARNRLGC